MCSSGCFLNFGHAKPRMRMTAGLDRRRAGLLRHRRRGRLPGRHGAAPQRPRQHLLPRRVPLRRRARDRAAGGRRAAASCIALSYGTDDYPQRELRTWFTHQGPEPGDHGEPAQLLPELQRGRSTARSARSTPTSGVLKPGMQNLGYCSAGQLSPLLNDPLYETIGIGTSVWLAGAPGHVLRRGHAARARSASAGRTTCRPRARARSALTADMKQMRPEFVRGVSLVGYGVSLALGIGIPIPILTAQMLEHDHGARPRHPRAGGRLLRRLPEPHRARCSAA